MKILSLQAENIKRLKAVEIKFEGPLVQIAGKNGQGKTSILDSIWWAFTGKSHIQATPIRRGCEEARIVVDLGEIIVTRTFNTKKDGDYTTHLTVRSAEGANFPSPQAMLDKLYGKLTFDPLDFVNKPPKDQVAVLRNFVTEFDITATEQEIARTFAKRTEIGRECDRTKALAESVVVPPNTPDEPVDEEALANELEKAVSANYEIDKMRQRRATAALAIKQAIEQAALLRTQAEEVERRAQEMQQKLEAEAPLPDPVDVEALRARHRQAREMNDLVELKRIKQEQFEEHGKLEAIYKELTEKIEQGRDSIERAIAEADLPVPGLSFGGEAVSLNGLPFEQASDAERLRVSTAVAMALNPELRVVRVRDGSLLDDAAMQLLAKMAEERDYLVIVERVQPADGVGLIVQIEDGAVKE